MKLFTAVLTASALAGSGSMFAASPNSILSVHVPFSFTAAGQEFAPGDYRVLEDTNGIICLQGSGKAVMALTTPSSGKFTAAPALQFASRDSHAHLVAIQDGSQLRSIPLGEDLERKLTVGTR